MHASPASSSGEKEESRPRCRSYHRPGFLARSICGNGSPTRWQGALPRFALPRATTTSMHLQRDTPTPASSCDEWRRQAPHAGGRVALSARPRFPLRRAVPGRGTQTSPAAATNRGPARPTRPSSHARFLLQTRRSTHVQPVGKAATLCGSTLCLVAGWANGAGQYRRRLSRRRTGPRAACEKIGRKPMGRKLSMSAASCADSWHEATQQWESLRQAKWSANKTEAQRQRGN